MGASLPIYPPVREDRPIDSPGRITSATDLGRQARARRKAAGLTQVEVAELAGVGERFVSEFERGKATAELGKVLRLCQRIGLDLYAAPRGQDWREL